MARMSKTLTVSLFACCCLSFAACGDDSSSSSSNRPKPRKNSKRKAKAKSKAKGTLATYPKVDSKLRHKWSEIDFVPDANAKTNRDPFQARVQAAAEESDTPVIQVVDVCVDSKRGVNWEAENYSIRDLELIGLVKRGRSFAQFTDKGELDSWIVQKGDCLGQEKAVVQEIGVGFVQLEISPPAPPGRPAPPSQLQKIVLNPEERSIDSSTIISKKRVLR